jgi:hypothetical protein
MKKDKLYIDMPDDITIEKEINFIVEKGIKKEESFYLYMKNVYRQVGIKYLFHDASEIIFVTSLVLSLLIFLGLNRGFQMNIRAGSLYVFIMIVSPLLYLLISLVSFISTKEKGMYELEMTCKYSLYQLAAFRMFVFSIICILSNVALVSILVAKYDEINFLRALIISITSLFLFSTLFIYTIVALRSKLAKYIVIIGWIVINLILSVFSIDVYIKLLTSIPIAVYFIVTVAFMYIYLKKLKKLINFTSMRGVI